MNLDEDFILAIFHQQIRLNGGGFGVSTNVLKVNVNINLHNVMWPKF